MPKATLTLTIPENVWIGELTGQYPDANFHVLAALADDHTGVGLVKITAPDTDSVLSDLEDYDDLTSLAILEHRDGSALVQIETTLPILLEPAQRSGIPVEMPFTIQAGTVVWELTASRDRLSALSQQLDQFGIPFTVESIYRELESTPLLTDKQWNVLTAAVHEGYYDTPRTCTQEELAAELGLAKSTCSETLHRAEERIVKQFMDNQTEEDSQNTELRPMVA